MKAIEWYFPVVLFIMLKVVLTKSVDEILKCDHTNETSSTALSRGAVCFQYFTILYKDIYIYIYIYEYFRFVCSWN